MVTDPARATPEQCLLRLQVYADIAAILSGRGLELDAFLELLGDSILESAEAEADPNARACLLASAERLHDAALEWRFANK